VGYVVKSSIDAIKTVCAIGRSNHNFGVNQTIITQLPNKLRAQQDVFKYTGGIHGCALFDSKGNLEIIREDVGRHNALDKLIGSLISNKNEINSFEEKILLFKWKS